jgi:hypothetical protein
MPTEIPLAFAVNNQTEINYVEARSEKEAPAFSEIREILSKYGLERKYGIALLHKHFDLAEDEVLVEFTDLEARTLTSKPIKIGTIPPTSLIETSWMLDHDVVMGNCVTVCYYDPSRNGHVGQHRPSGP